MKSDKCYHGKPLSGECPKCRAYVDSLFRDRDPIPSGKRFRHNQFTGKDILVLASAVCRMHDYDEIQPQCVIALREALAARAAQQQQAPAESAETGEGARIETCSMGDSE